MVLAAIKHTISGEPPMQTPLPFLDNVPALTVVKSPRIKAAPVPSPAAFYWGADGIQPVGLKYRDGEFHSSFGAWSAPGYSSRDFSASEDGYARAYMACVWAFRAINVFVQKISDVLRKGQVVNKQTGREIPDHALLTAFDLAYTMYQQDIFEYWLLSKSLYGEAYVELVNAFPVNPQSIGIPRGVRVLNALGIEPVIQRGAIVQYRYNGDDAQATFTPFEIAFDKYANPLDDARGLSPLAAALDSVNIDRKIVLFTGAHLRNNARPGLIFTPKEGRLSQADVDMIQSTLSEDVKGAQNAGNPLLMPTAFDVTVAEPPKMDDLNVLTDEHKRRICSAIGVPVALVDYTDMAFQLSPEQNKTFYELTVIPNAEKVARVINTQVLPFFDRSRQNEFKIPVDNVRAQLADPRARTEIANMRLQAGAITLNEYRSQLDMDAVPDGDVRFLPMGVQIVKAGELGQTPAPLPQTPSSPLLGAGNGIVADAQPTAAQAVDAPPISEAARLEMKNWRIKIDRKGRNAEFTVVELADETAEYVRTALKSDMPIDAIFERAREIELEALKKKATAPAQYATPEEYLEYWGDYDALMAEIGDDWLTLYMQEILVDLENADGVPTVNQIARMLEAKRPDLVEQWVGTEETPGSLARIILAGMGAGQTSLEKNQSIDPDKATKAVTLAVDWKLLSKEAVEFIRNYAFNLIRGINQTTVQQVQTALQDWSRSGESLDALKQRLAQVFGNRARANLIAQTETTRAYNEGANQRWRDAGVTRAKWQTVVDSHVCPICAPLHNTVADLNTGWKSKKGNVHPPAHPGCRCFSRPVLDADPADLEAQAQNVLDRLEQRAQASAAAVDTRSPQTVEYERLIAYDKVEAFAQSNRANIDRLESAQVDAVREYTGGEYRLINQLGRGEFPEQATQEARQRYQQYTDSLDEALRRSAVPDNVRVYRGVDRSGITWFDPDNRDSALGVEISDAGFMSTSIDDSVVDEFVRKGGAVFEIRVPRGSNGLYVRDISYKPEESELLLPRNTRMRVVEIREHDYISGAWHIVLEVIQ